MRIRLTGFLLFLFSLVFVSSTLMATGKPPCIITGPTVVCTNQSATYQVDVNNPAYTYQWTITGGTLLSQTGNTCTVQWNVAGTGSISVNIYQNGTLLNNCTLTANIYNTPSPNIIPSFEATCFDVPDPGGETLASVGRPKEDPCSKVCENSTVVYRVSYHAGSTYNWQINGLSYSSASGQNTNIFTVTWGTVSSGTIQVTETNAAGCSKTVYKCLEIIRAPVAKFSTSPAHDGSSVTICRDQTVTFTDLSTATGNSPIVSWVWDFGDGTGTATYTAGASVSHQYTNTNNGNAYYATLTVKNACGCESTFGIKVFVRKFDAPQLICPSTVCCGKATKYSIKHAENEQDGCGYMWSVTGGTLVSPAGGQVADEGTIIWDCEATPKTITLIPVNCNGCNNPIVYTAAVITANAGINGKTIVCPNSEEVYSIPAMPGCTFTWSLSDPAAGDIFAGAETNAIKIRWSSGFSGTVELNVHYVNTVLGCEGNGKLIITMRPALVIAANPSGNICTGGVTFTSFNEFGGTVNTSWQINQLPSGTNVHNDGGPVSSTFYFFNTGGDFEIIATDNGGNTCNSPVKLIKTITGVPPVHTGTLTGQTFNICPGQSYMYTATATSSDYNLVWDASPAGTVTPTSGNKVNIIWTGAGQIKIYQVSKTNPACTSAVRVINVTMVPPPNCNITGNYNACPNSTFTYTAAAGYSNYTWLISPSGAGSIISGQGTSSINVQWHNTASPVTAILNVAIQYCGSVVQNCSSPAITISTAPASVITPANSSVCQNDLQSFSVSNTGASAVWNWGDGSTTNVTGPTLSASHQYTTPGTYNITIVVQQPGGCYGATSTAGTSVTVSSRPTVAISLGGSAQTKLCPNDPPTAVPATLVATILSGGCGTAGTIQWYKNGVIIPGATGNSYNPAWPSTAGAVDTYTFRYGCPGIPCNTATSDPVYIIRAITCDVCSLAVLPNPTLSWGQTPATACGSGTLSYTAPSPGFATKLDFDDLTTPAFMPPNNPNSSTVSHTYTRAGIYHPALYTKYPSTTPGEYCDVLKAAEVVVPVIANATVSVVCNPAGGYNIIVNDISDRLATYNSTPVRQCQLDGNAPVNMNPSTSYTFTGIAAGSHTITFRIAVSDGANTYQCEITKPAILPVISTPAINIVQGSPRCIGAPVQFTTSAASVAAYVWQFGDATSSLLPDPTHQYNATFSPVTVNLQITTNEGCVATNSTTLTILPNNLVVSVTSNAGSSPAYICQGSAGPLLTANVTGANGAAGYVWNTTTLNNISTGNPIVAGNQVSDKYSVTVTDAIGCIRTSSPFEVIVKPAPVASILGRDEYCSDEIVSLSAQPGSGYTYQWTVNNINYGTSPAISFYGNTGTYNVTLVVTSNGCSSTTAITVKVNSNPYVYVTPGFNSQLCAGQPNLLTANVIPGTGTAPFAYYWNTVPVQNTQSVTVSAAGLYQATVIDANGCKASDRTRVYKVEDFTNFMSGCYELCNNKSIELVGPKSPSIANFPLPPDNVPYQIVYSYQWYKDGVPIPAPDGTNANYTVDPNPGPYSGSGQYTLSITSTLPSAGCEINSLTSYEKSFNVNFVECCKAKVDIAISNIYCLNGQQDPIRYVLILNVYNPFPNPATITFNSPNGPVYTVPAANNLPASGWNTITVYLDDMQNLGRFCITGGTITDDKTQQTCEYEIDVCAELPKCENLCTERPTCECLGRTITPSIRCSLTRPIPGYSYAYDFSVTFDWACHSIVKPIVISTCGIFGSLTPAYIVGGTNVLSGVFYTNQPPGNICNFTVVLVDERGREICRFCVRLRLNCRSRFTEEQIVSKGAAGSPAAATTATNPAGKTTATAKSSQPGAKTSTVWPVALKELTIVPNPASSFANINYSFSKESNNSIVIYSLLGTPVKTFTGLPGSGTLRVDISTLAGGTYIVKALGTEKILIAKLEIVR